jgi:Beige/BEACH domain/PH domain associated with Beige/BEACH/WD domain, G-beta repeat
VRTDASKYDTSLLDYEIILGLISNNDWPLQSTYNVSRSVGLETRQAVLIVCRSSVIIIDGYEKPGQQMNRTGSFGGTLGGSQGRLERGYLLKGLRRVGASTGGAIAGGATASGGAVKPRVVLRRGDCTTGVWLDDDDEHYCSDDTSATAKAAHSGHSEGWSHDSLADTVSLSSLSAAAAVACSSSSSSSSSSSLSLYEGLGVFRLLTDDLLAAYKRRYQLRDVALELFDVQGRSVLVSFDCQKHQEEVLAALLARELPRSIFTKGKHRMKLPVTGGLAGARTAYKKFMQALRLSFTKRWQAGQVSNFEYLMALNTLAGRTLNDITQYPVFPWVLQDYESSVLDLSNPRVYRDLSKPMGALGASRAAQFVERYTSVVESAQESGEEPDPPAFHYGTHYSCAGYVLYYLLRLEPFTQMAVSLQGGRFDRADRLFRDVRSSWESASSENLQDVRELTPEFFYLPDFLVNANNFDFGVTQRGAVVHHVDLPPWARGDPREFVRVQRRALESVYVSTHLSSWVDLIFGCKQRGPEAVAAQNVFVHLTYEGEVDLDAIDDPMLREATIAQIHNFGQTPTRLFKKAHPRREIPSVIRTDDRGARSVDATAYAWHLPLTPALCIVGFPEIAALKAVSLTGATSASSVSSSSASSSGGTGSGSGTAAAAVQHSDGAVGDACLARDKMVTVGRRCVLYPGAANADEFIRYGGASCGLAFYQTATASKATAAAEAVLLSCHDALHLQPLTAVACSQSGALCVTASADGSVRMWRVTAAVAAASSYSSAQYSGFRGAVSTVSSAASSAAAGSTGSSSDLRKSLTLVATFAGHSGAVGCLHICEEFSIVLSGGAEDGCVYMWDALHCTLLRELEASAGCAYAVSSVHTNRTTGSTVTLAGSELRVFGLNGDLLARCSATALRRSSPTVAVSTECAEWQDGVVAVTGHDNGDVSLWGIRWTQPAVDTSKLLYEHYRAGRGGTGTAAGTTASPHASGASSGDYSSVSSSFGSSRQQYHQQQQQQQSQQVRDLVCMRVLNGAHSRAVTCLRVCSNQRELLVGDAKGIVSRWQCLKLGDMPQSELNELVSA